LTGLLHRMNDSSLAAGVIYRIGAAHFGGYLGYVPYEWFLWMLGAVGAIIVYSTLGLISLLFLTGFQLGEWLRRWFSDEPSTKGMSEEEAALERRARDLQKQA